MQPGCRSLCVSRLHRVLGRQRSHSQPDIHTTVRERFLRFHGERYAQLDSNKSVFEEDPKHKQHSGLFEAVSRFLFSTPHVYYEQLDSIWVDNKINYDHWSNFISELQGDWAASITPVSRQA